jgi:glycosyltransferase involved in cell wall biosynthesis
VSALGASGNGARAPGVVILTETYHPVRGGGETQARSLAQGLAERGWRVLVITRRSDRSLSPHEAMGGVRIRRIPPTGPARRKKWGLVLTGFWALIRHRAAYDVVLVSGFRLLGIPATTVGRLLGKACVLKADSLGEMSGDYFAAGLRSVAMTPRSWPFRAFLTARNRILEGAHAFVSISSVIRDELLGAGVAAHRIVSIPNSVNTVRFRPPDSLERIAARKALGFPLHRTVTVYTGRLVSYKGLPMLLRVWKELVMDGHPGVLLMVGAGGLDMHDCEEELKAYVDHHGLTNSVSFAGEVQDVQPFLQAADVFVLPSENEAFGISAIEAMANGLPVVSSDAGGLADVVDPNVTGLVFRSGDPVGLRRCLDRLLRDQHLRETLGRAGRDRAVAEYSEARIVSRYDALLAQCAHAQGG